ncbi:hypothetical protein PSYAE_23263 [Pseudomonas amygdali pv. aesculi str. 0893_23]|nr:hypothetical protein PSYAE_23263 [Pseudomonas amygdali pv. aesculi str. 0893_23]
MLVGFAGVVPEKLPFVEPGLGVELEVQRLDLGHAFQRVQVRTGTKRRCCISQWPAFANQPGVARARQITGAGEHSARLLLPQTLDDLAAQGAE